jgi:hypothetical protein
MVTIHKHEFSLDIGAKEPIARCGCGAWCTVDIENNVWGEIHEPQLKEGMRMSTKKAGRKLDDRWPELKEALGRLKNLNQAAKECGVTYSSLLGCAERHGFDLTGYRPVVASKQVSVDVTPKTNHDGGIPLLIGMLPKVRFNSDNEKVRWKVAFDAMFELIYGGG